MRYLDTSVVVAALVPEIHTDRIHQWLNEQNPEELAISDWVTTEFSSALSIKIRTGQISQKDRLQALGNFARLSGGFIRVLSLSTARFKVAALFAERYELAIKGGDALHLAVAAEHGAILCTLDRRLFEAGPKLGVRTELLSAASPPPN